MKALCLFGVLLVARILMLAGRDLPISPWTPAAIVWQDIVAALVFAALDAVVRRPIFIWILYAATVVYTAINVPIARLFSTPLTWPMIGSAKGPLLDSIVIYLNPLNAALMLVIIGTGVFFPVVLQRVKVRPRKTLIIAALVVSALGLIATTQVPTLGLERNALGALIPTVGALYERPSAVIDRAYSNWRISPFGPGAAEDLSRYSGIAADRNVVVLILESTGARYLNPYGAVEDPTPHLTRLASQSILFENAYAVYPESIKGLLSTLCSSYPEMNRAVESLSSMPCAPVARQFMNIGYRTALFHSGRFDYLGMDSVINTRGFEVAEDAGHIGGQVNSSFGVDEPSTVARMLKWIDTVREDRFLLTYMPIAGHHPYGSPEPGPFQEENDIDAYRNALHYGDAAIGEFLHGLKVRNLVDETIFIVFGDHGEAFGQHDGNYGHTFFIYDENVRVPLLIAIPGVLEHQVRVRKIASLVDVAPTLLELAGLPIPEIYQGRSLLGSTSQMALFFTDYSLPWAGLRDGCWKFMHDMSSGWSRLYDLCVDPNETRETTDAHGERVRRYRETLNSWILRRDPL